MNINHRKQSRWSIVAAAMALLAMTAVSSAQSDATLSDLVSSTGPLTPGFESTVETYTATVAYPTPTMTVTPTKTEAGGTITIAINAGTPATIDSGNTSDPISLSAGSANVITLEVKSADNSATKTYTLTVTVTVADPVAIPGGPYSVLSSGSLSLNGSASLPSDGQTITDPTGYEWDLDNDGDFSDNPVTGATPTAITYADLKSVHGMTVGANTIKLRVTDSAMGTSIVSTTVTLLTAVIHEPFAQTAGNINGKASSTTGLTGSWTVGAGTVNVVNPDTITHGALANSGGQVDIPNASSVHARVTTSSALADAGLLADGAELWFSLVFQKTSTGASSNEWSGFAFGTNYVFGTSGAVNMNASGNGLGFITKGTALDVTTWTGGANTRTTSHSITASTPTVIVGNIKWGATPADVERSPYTKLPQTFHRWGPAFQGRCLGLTKHSSTPSALPSAIPAAHTPTTKSASARLRPMCFPSPPACPTCSRSWMTRTVARSVRMLPSSPTT